MAELAYLDIDFEVVDDRVTQETVKVELLAKDETGHVLVRRPDGGEVWVARDELRDQP